MNSGERLGLAGRRSDLRLALLVVAVAAAAYVGWQVAGTLLLLFAGLLFGSLLDALTRGMHYVLPIARPWRLAIVCLALAVLLGLGLLWGGATLAAQADSLMRILDEQLHVLRGELRDIGLTSRPQNGEQRSILRLIFPDPGSLLGTAYTAFSTATGFLGNFIIIVFVGIFAAASPQSYCRGLLSLTPQRHRQRFGQVLDEMGSTLRRWLTAQLIAVVVVGLTTWGALSLIGMEGAFLLGLQAGLFNFIPYLGPVVATVPILLAAMAQGTTMVVWALAVQVIIQTVEGYILAPLLLREAVDLPPVLTLAAVVIFGALFGALGIALATPILAVVRVAVIRLYIEDRLGGGMEKKSEV